MLPYQPELVKLHLESDADKISPDMKVTGGEGGEALRKCVSTFTGLNYVWPLSRVRHRVIQSKALRGNETPRQCVVKVDYSTITLTHTQKQGCLRSFLIHYHVCSVFSAIFTSALYSCFNIFVHLVLGLKMKTFAPLVIFIKQVHPK